MDIYKHSGHAVYHFTKRIFLFNQYTKVLFWHKGKLMPNFRFIIRPHKQWQYFHWFIRQPYFYFERNNSGIYIGTPNKYFHFQKQYR